MLVYQRVVSTQIEKSDGDQPSTSWCGNLENPFRIRRVVSMVSRGSGLPPVSHAKNIVFVDGFPLSPPSPCTLGEGHERSEPHRWAVQMSAESWTDGKSPWLNIALPCHVVASKNDQSLGGSDQWPSLCLSISIYGGSQFKLMESGKTPIWLVVTGTWISFFHILGISSSQLTFIFFRGEPAKVIWNNDSNPLELWVSHYGDGITASPIHASLHAVASPLQEVEMESKAAAAVLRRGVW
jgi:hypothetical protein